MQYEVTIGIPLYNAGQFIRESLGSALAQTFESIEFLVVDDCSTDNSASIVRQMQNEHPRGHDIRLVARSQNMGVGEARNCIIDEARGRYLYFMDADDLIEPSTIELLHDTMIEIGADFVMGSYDKTEPCDDTGTPKTTVHQYIYAELYEKDTAPDFFFRKYGGIQAAVWNYLVDIKLLRDNGLRFVRSQFWEDMVFTYMLITHVTAAVTMPEITYHYICREESLSKYQRRERIEKSEVLANVATIDTLKNYTQTLAGKCYLGGWCYNIVMTDFYIVCNVIKKRSIIQPSFTNAELHSFMRHPLNLGAILRIEDDKRMANLLLYLLSKLPAAVSIWIIRQAGRRKGLI